MRSSLPVLALAASLTLLFSEACAATTSYIPIEFRQVSGTRPFVQVAVNGKPFLFMVHANASFYAMTTHANAASAGIENLVKKSAYGIESSGKVSDLGRAEATLKSLTVGASSATDVPLSVFEVPQDPPMDGMLGMKWLRDKRVVIDYDQGKVGFPTVPEDGQTEDARLVARGWVAHKMRWDTATSSYYVAGVVNGTTVQLQVSTVGQNTLNDGFAKSANVLVGPKVDDFGGPAGATGDVFIAKTPLSIELDGQRAAAIQPLIWNFDAYSSRKKPSGIQATLGADFMLANLAVIDFGTETLLIKPATP